MKIVGSGRMRTAVGALAIAGATSPAIANDNSAVAAIIMDIVRAQWAGEMDSKSAAEQMASVVDDYSEYNPVFATRIDGKTMAMEFAAVDDGTTSLMAEMQNPRVQVYGDTAILTYNYAGMVRDKDGKVTPRLAKSTRVYVKMTSGWMLVHANFAPATAA